MLQVLVLYYSRHGSVRALANEFAAGVATVAGVEPLLRTVPAVSVDYQEDRESIPESGPPYCSLEEFAEASALALGSPGRFGNMAAALKYFLEQTTSAWVSGAMVGKPATLFTSTTTAHGGQESTLLSMMAPLLHHGMLISGVPFTEPALHKDCQGGTPYGVSHIAGHNHQALHPEIEKLARRQGKRLAEYAVTLAHD